ncbi:MAG: hypothetical protein IPJ39_16715 [Saprospiraceae bacterium]|nr:hypothetical protein [Saprospiraceae bacterium]
MKYILILIIMLSFPNSFFSQAADTIFLYKQKNGQDDPAMFAYKPKGIATKAAVIIFPVVDIKVWLWIMKVCKWHNGTLIEVVLLMY